MQTAAEQTTKMDQTLQWTAPEVLKPLPFAKLIPLMQAAVNAAPRRTDLQLKLAKAYFHTDRMADLIDLLAPALHHESTDAEALFYLGRAYLSIQNDQLAIEALSRAASQGIIHAFGFLAEAFERLGRHDGALKASLDGLFLSPTDYKAFGMATRALLMRREKSRLWDLCTDLNNRGAWAAYVPSAMALVANTLAAEDQVMRLIDPPAWFSARRLDVTKDFNQALAAELLAQMPPSPLPSTQATVGTGRRIDQLQVVAGPLATQLLSNIKDAVENYFAERSTLTHHPMIAQRPHSITLHPWALAVQGDGHETWHIHPSGWISGVYYVQVPQINVAPATEAGAIEFGPYQFGSKAKSSAWPRWMVKPEEGTLLLFPSYYAHRTYPTGVEDFRICVAFDIVPS